jgi:hypothetical protein
LGALGVFAFMEERKAVAGKPGRQQVRCQDCNRILFERAGGLAFKEYRIHQRAMRDVFMVPVRIDCQGCGRPWLNPEMVAFDGIGAVVERAIADVRAHIERAAEGGESRRRGLRRPAAA